MNKALLLIFILLNGASAFAVEDPTGGKPFLPWLWEDQFRPVLRQTTDVGNLAILAAGGLSSVAAFQYEGDVYEHNRKGENLIMTADTAGVLGTVGGGGLGIGIAVTQILLDQKNGLRHARAIALTSLSHVTLAYSFQKKRPGGRGDYLPFASSFPSGHAASAFATATSLSYAYGYGVGIPAYLLATSIAAARVSENAHWLSDVFAGAALGLFWGRASYLADAADDETNVSWMPIPIEGGFALQASLRY